MAAGKNVDNYGDALRGILSAIADAQGVPGANIPELIKLQFQVIGMIQKGPQLPNQGGQQQQTPGGQPGQPNPMSGAMSPGGGAVNPQQVTPGMGMMQGHTTEIQNNPDELRRMLQQQLAG